MKPIDKDLLLPAEVEQTEPEQDNSLWLIAAGLVLFGICVGVPIGLAIG
jgi:hypothetical protein